MLQILTMGQPVGSAKAGRYAFEVQADLPLDVRLLTCAARDLSKQRSAQVMFPFAPGLWLR